MSTTMFSSRLAAVVAILWLISAFLATSAFPTQGSEVWIAPGAGVVVAECYPLFIQFTSPVAPRNMSFFYYVGAQTDAGQTIVPITSWAESMWIDEGTLFNVSVASVPVAAGTMMALQVVNHDNSQSYLHQIVIQPNMDVSCITSAYQRGISHYNSFAQLPVSTTVSPSTLSSLGSSTDAPLPSATSTEGAFPTQGSAVWLAPGAGPVIAECYPLSIEFTTPVPTRNVSFFYYVGAQTDADQTIVPVITWPESMWISTSTLYSVQVASVPVAAGTMMALQVVNYDNSESYLHAIVVQPNVDDSCITSAYQRGISHYNRFAASSATTTVSSNMISSPSSGASTSSTPKSNAPSSTQNTTSTSPAAHKKSNSGVIAGATIAALAGLALAAAVGAWFARRHLVRRADKHSAAPNPAFIQPTTSFIVEPYVPTPPPPRRTIQEVDGGPLPEDEPERLPPVYSEISGSSGTQSPSIATTTVTGPPSSGPGSSRPSRTKN
ncbi:hypothetical protein C8R45DRAFT_1030505 [Mycena sanguinolenta]|nr:hypothetical protein C8R45DRAFT_1030505 [Mycena sanguinolenta]